MEQDQPILTATEIEDFRKAIKKPDGHVDSALLLRVAESLKDADLSLLESQNYLTEVIGLVQDIRKKVFPQGHEHPREVEELYAKVKGITQQLQFKRKKGQYDDVFFSNVYNLGMLIEDLTSHLTAFLPLILVLRHSMFN